MKYGTFKYAIRYKDGDSVQGWTPYKGESMSKSWLVQFAARYFRDSRQVAHIRIFDVFEISRPEVWWAHIRRSVEYRFIAARGFMAGA